MKMSKNPADNKKAENNILFVNCATIIYALVLALMYVMSRSSETIIGALGMVRVLMFGGIIAAMLTAAYAAYKSNKSFLKYAFMCVFISLSSAALLYCNNGNRGYMIDFAALFAALVFNLVYAYLNDKNLYYKQKSTRIIFKSVVGTVYGLFFVLLLLIFFGII